MYLMYLNFDCATNDSEINLSIEVKSAKISKEPSNIHTATESDEKDDITIFYVRIIKINII